MGDLRRFAIIPRQEDPYDVLDLGQLTVPLPVPAPARLTGRPHRPRTAPSLNPAALAGER